MSECSKCGQEIETEEWESMTPKEIAGKSYEMLKVIGITLFFCLIAGIIGIASILS